MSANGRPRGEVARAEVVWSAAPKSEAAPIGRMNSKDRTRHRGNILTTMGSGDDRMDAEDESAEAGPSIPSLEVWSQQQKVHRVIVVAPAKEVKASYLESIFAHCELAIPPVLDDWLDCVDDWCDEYRADFDDAFLLEINLTTAVFVFDRTHERVVVAYGVATSPTRPRDHNRMRQFPDVNVGVVATMGTAAFASDRGHFLSHASGGDLDINLFPHRRELNRGWSEEGKRFRRMEKWVADNPGSFHYHRAEYTDRTWIPASLEYGVLRDNREWWIDSFRNR